MCISFGPRPLALKVATLVKYEVMCSEVQGFDILESCIYYCVFWQSRSVTISFGRFPVSTQSLGRSPCHKPVACDIIHYYSLPLWQETEHQTKNSHIIDQEGVKVINQESVDSRDKDQGDHSIPMTEAIQGLRSPHHIRPPVITWPK